MTLAGYTLKYRNQEPILNDPNRTGGFAVLDVHGHWRGTLKTGDVTYTGFAPTRPTARSGSRRLALHAARIST